MSTIRSSFSRASIPGYRQNAVVHLILASAICFISYWLTDVILKVAEANPDIFPLSFTRNLALPRVAFFTEKFWTVITYGWIHNGFWELFSNMLWLYTFGSLVQMMVGYKQVIPLFIYALIMGGLFYEFSQLLPGAAFQVRYNLLGGDAGIVAMAVAALTIAPSYRFYLGDRLSIPLVLVACIFFLLVIINSNLDLPRLFLLAGGAAMGFGYIKLLQSGYKPGIWMYSIFERMENMITPDDSTVKKQGKKRSQVLQMGPPKQDSKQKRVDELLDKINQKGYNSLSAEEKEFLLKASNENDN